MADIDQMTWKEMTAEQRAEAVERMTHIFNAEMQKLEDEVNEWLVAHGIPVRVHTSAHIRRAS